MQSKKIQSFFCNLPRYLESQVRNREVCAKFKSLQIWFFRVAAKPEAKMHSQHRPCKRATFLPRTIFLSLLCLGKGVAKLDWDEKDESFTEGGKGLERERDERECAFWVLFSDGRRRETRLLRFLTPFSLEVNPRLLSSSSSSSSSSFPRREKWGTEGGDGRRIPRRLFFGKKQA